MFDESKHKRVPKGNPEGGRFAKTSDGAGGTHEATEAEKKRMNELGINKPNLTKQEWAIFYDRMSDIKNGHYVDKLPNGDMIVPIETNERGVLVIASGKYGNEKVKEIKAFKDKDYMYDMIERLKNGF